MHNKITKIIFAAGWVYVGVKGRILFERFKQTKKVKRALKRRERRYKNNDVADFVEYREKNTFLG